MIRVWLSGVTTALGLSALAGCTGPVIPTDVTTPGMPNAELALQQSISQVNADMAQIGAMRLADDMATAPLQPVTPAELQKPVEFVWRGPLDGGVQKLAQSIGYSVSIYAPKNAALIKVTVVSDGPVLEAFKAFGVQAGTLATVELDPQHHQVQVIHHA